eukprot:772121-Alexandrium_andersonii.AAC.1
MLLAAAEHCSRHIVVLQADGGRWKVRKSLAPLSAKKRQVADRNAAWVIAWRNDHFLAVEVVAGTAPPAWSFPTSER